MSAAASAAGAGRQAALALERLLAALPARSAVDVQTPALAAGLAAVLDLHSDLQLYRALHGAAGKPGRAADAATVASSLEALGKALARLQRLSVKAAAVSAGDELDEVLQSCLDEVAEVVGADTVSALFAPLQRHYLVEQRKLVSNITLWRGRLRALLATASPAARRLAAIDEVLEQGLQDHERQQLGRLWNVLARHGESLSLSGTDPDRDTVCTALRACAAEMRQWLAAETAFRLLPLQGLFASAQALLAEDEGGPSPR